MPESLLPEAIRGSWFLLADDGKSPSVALGGRVQFLSFRLNGSFARFDLKSEDAPLEQDAGEYTFDGDFLILRGNNTETYRVGVERPWCWKLEAKRKRRRLLRGVLEAADFVELADPELREIDTFSHRVRVEPVAPVGGAIFDLIFSHSPESTFRIGCFSVDFDRLTGELWVGLTPTVCNLSAALWAKIIAQSYLRGHRKEFPGIERAVLDILGSGTLQELELPG